MPGGGCPGVGVRMRGVRDGVEGGADTPGHPRVNSTGVNKYSRLNEGVTGGTVNLTTFVFSLIEFEDFT